MDDIQKTLIEAGRKDLAQEYFEKTTSTNKKAKIYGQDEIGQAMNYAIEELESAIKNVKNPDGWAEKKWRTANEVIKLIEKLTVTFERMK